jgi:hypothetical protein
MAKKAAAVKRELTAAEKAALTRKVNVCAVEQIQSDHHGGMASTLKKEIRATMDAGQIDGKDIDQYETAEAFARLDTKETRKTDDDAIEAIRQIVDGADFDKICPRKIDLKAFDEVIGHHSYEGLEKLLKTSHPKALTVGQLSR